MTQGQASGCLQALKKKQKELPTGMAFIPVAHLLGLVVFEGKGREALLTHGLEGPSTPRGLAVCLHRSGRARTVRQWKSPPQALGFCPCIQGMGTLFPACTSFAPLKGPAP